jgi:hypothetical protein
MSHKTANKGRCILAALAAVALLSASGCRLFSPPFRRNPKLRLLRSERGGLKEPESSLFHPVVSPDGAQVYYLSWGPSSGLWRTGLSDTSGVNVLPGTFTSMAMSPDGQRIVLVPEGQGGICGPLVTFDLGTAVTETLFYDIDAYDLEFSRTVAGRFYYSSRNTGLHWWDIDSSNDVLVDSTIRRYFDLTSSDSVVQGLYKPRVHPGGRYVACVLPSAGIALVDLAAKDTIPLNAKPYELAGVSSPYWTPDGKALVFSAVEGRLGDPNWVSSSELWVLDDVFK